jgi:hypothetical protein
MREDRVGEQEVEPAEPIESEPPIGVDQGRALVGQSLVCGQPASVFDLGVRQVDAGVAICIEITDEMQACEERSGQLHAGSKGLVLLRVETSNLARGYGMRDSTPQRVHCGLELHHLKMSTLPSGRRRTFIQTSRHFPCSSLPFTNEASISRGKASP